MADDGVLVIRRIEVVYHLRAHPAIPLAPAAVDRKVRRRTSRRRSGVRAVLALLAASLGAAARGAEPPPDLADPAEALTAAQRVLDPGFAVPRWLVRRALRSDLPELLGALKERGKAQPDHETPSTEAAP
ncbi:MAG TPA: hypothetical protein VMT85_10365 [Thermoanaerobaculia bacterium]|nr:hypothetical protein [Thermoanaerobaculia bacterium]